MIAEVSGAWNCRDVAHAAGIRAGRLFRSSELSGVDDDGRAALGRLGVTDVADLRSVGEVERHGASVVPDGVAVHRLAFDGDRVAPHEQAFERMLSEKPDGEDPVAAARRFMIEEYERFSALPGTRAALGKVIRMVADGRSVLISCFAGKDRTGLAVAVVLEAVGVDRDSITSDFLASNESVPALREHILRGIETRTEKVTPELLDYVRTRLPDQVLGVREEYLDAARKTIDRQYGSLARFLGAAGVDDQALRRARSALLS
ncbi:tyrosine-protein phosphatase [Mycobacterium parmense]|nr:tyrosine-protein phosphatase [Mycobacterium parmense]ORW61215.1 phosphotyrosine protein phosphatase [Mycobacterium parmense]